MKRAENNIGAGVLEIIHVLIDQDAIENSDDNYEDKIENSEENSHHRHASTSVLSRVAFDLASLHKSDNDRRNSSKRPETTNKAYDSKYKRDYGKRRIWSRLSWRRRRALVLDRRCILPPGIGNRRRVPVSRSRRGCRRLIERASSGRLLEYRFRLLGKTRRRRFRRRWLWSVER